MGEPTPRPWRWDENEACDLFAVVGDDGTLVTEIPLNGHGDLEANVRADCRLIVRAVNSFDAMREALGVASDLICTQLCGKSDEHDHAEACVRARAALMLAGVSP